MSLFKTFIMRKEELIMRITASSINQKKTPAFEAHMADFGELAKIIPKSKFDEFIKTLNKPENQQRISDIKIWKQDPLIFVSEKTKTVEDGTEGEITAFYDTFIQKTVPLEIKEKDSGEKLVKNLIKSIESAADEVLAELQIYY